MAEAYHITPHGISIADLNAVVRERRPIALSAEAVEHINASEAWLQQRLANNTDAIYGVNTGFGSLYNTRIAPADLTQLQANLVMSHACGSGEPVPADVVRAMLVLKVQNMAFGRSAVALSTVQRMIDHYNNDVLPVVYKRGSLGASGDLAPLAHLALPLLGLGEVVSGGRRMAASTAIGIMGWPALTLGPKEGIALLNGTQFMSAYAALLVYQCERLLDQSEVIASMSLEAFDGRREPFDARIHAVRPHEGQGLVAERMRDLLEGSQLIAREKEHVQDPYSFRCIPQVHGASRDALAFVKRTIATELASVTDNPTVFAEKGDIISGGNFHGQPLAIALDLLCIAMAEIGSISERRTYKLISGQRGLPPFLVKEPGINSGFMIPQYTAASLVSANKQRSMPNSVDTIDSSNGQEDHVSMGAAAAVKAFALVQDVERILAIELLNAAQALDFRRPARSSKYVEHIHAGLRKTVPFVEKDVVMHELMEATLAYLRA